MRRTRSTTQQGLHTSALLPGLPPVTRRTTPAMSSRASSPAPDPAAVANPNPNPDPNPNPNPDPAVDPASRPASPTPGGFRHARFQSEDQAQMDQFATVLSQAFARSGVTSGSSSAAKFRVPDTFDGSDPWKLRNFITQCEIYFFANSEKFKTDEKKVMFAFSYLRDAALEWFEQKFQVPSSTRRLPRIPESASRANSEDEAEVEIAPRRTSKSWQNDWSIFLDDLRTNFGPADSEAEAERRLTSLSMSSDKKITWYNLRFNRYSAQTGWDDRALRYRYYQGLPDRLQDALTIAGKPNTLKAMKELAITWDQRYWERQGEKKKHDSERSKSSNSKSSSGQSSSNQSHSSSSSSSSNNFRRPEKGKDKNKSGSNSNSASSSNSGKSSSSSSSSTNFLSDKLGKDGKLTPEERARRIANNLCLFCGLGGHKAADCKKAMKARAASVPKADTVSAPAADKAGKA